MRSLCQSGRGRAHPLRFEALTRPVPAAISRCRHTLERPDEFAMFLASALLFATQAVPATGTEARRCSLYSFGVVVGLPGTAGTAGHPRVRRRRDGVTLGGAPWTCAADRRGAGAGGSRVGGAGNRGGSPGHAPGRRGDAAASPLDDAGCLRGGILLATDLRGADGNVYAIAWGLLSAGTDKVARIPGGSRVTQRVRD